MVKNRKFNLIGLILALTCLLAASSAFVVYADETATVTERIQAAYSPDKVEESGVFGEDTDAYSEFFETAKNAAASLESEGERYLDVLEKINLIADNRIKVLNLIKGEFDNEVEAGDSRKEADKLASDYIKATALTSRNLAPSSFADVYDKQEESFGEFQTKLEAIKTADKNKFEELRQAAAEEVYNEYSSLIGIGSSGSGNQVAGSYSSEQAEVLTGVLNKYVDVSASGECAPAESGELAGVEYSAKDIVKQRKAINDIKDRAIAELKSVQRNILEIVHSEYLQFIAADDEYKSAEDGAEKEALREQRDELLLPLSENSFARVKKALNFYEGGSDEIKAKYSTEYAKLKKFAEDKPKAIVTEYVSSVSDEYGVAEITAYFEDATKGEAKVFRKPDEGGRLEVFPNANGAAKRNANNALKELDSSLSVAYFVKLAVYNGYKRVEEAPETAFIYNEDGSKKTDARGEPLTAKVYYRVKIDLNGYYEKYCAPRGYENDKLSNVENAFSVCKNSDSALCYAYIGESKEIEKVYISDSKQTELEGGKLVFYTTRFNDFCVAGTGLENLLTNPWIWLAAVAVLIILIIIIKAIIKNFKYTIKFIVNGGTRVAPLRVAKNEAIVLPKSPTKTGLIFAGWYTDEKCTVRFIETKLRRRKGFKLYAKWAAPINAEKLSEYYDGLRTLMVSYEKCSFKPTLGLVEKEMLANMFGEENFVDLYLVTKLAQAKEIVGGDGVTAHKNKKLAALPTRIIVCDEKTYADAVKLIEFTMLQNGLQLKEEMPETVVSTPEERKAGFAYFVKNERVASSMADYFELLRINLKSYVLEKDNGKFKPGDRFTFARIYFTSKNVDLYMPVCKGVKELEKGEHKPRFSDTPVHIVICDNGDMAKAFAVIESTMKAYGFTKYPENSNDLEDLALGETDGFAYTIRF